MDHVGPLSPDEHGFSYLLVVLDHFSKYCIVIPVKARDAVTTARALFFDVFLVHGFPRKLHSDNAPEFRSEVVTELCELMKIRKTYTTPYHPQSDGKNENSHKFLMQIVRILAEKHPSKWCDMARVAAFAWNTSTLQALDYLTPYELNAWTTSKPAACDDT